MPDPVVTHWVVEAFVNPGMRRVVTLCPAASGREAIQKALDHHGDCISHVMARPNFVVTGEIAPVVWQKDI